MTGLEYGLGRLLAFLLIVVLIFLLYRFIPVAGSRRAPGSAQLRRQSCFELTRVGYAALTGYLSPATIYTGGCIRSCQWSSGSITPRSFS